MNHKKILAVFLAVVMTCCGLPAIPVLATDTTANGDVNADATVDVRDLVRLRKYCASKNVNIDVNQSDWNGDSKINLNDVDRLREWLINPTDETAFIGLPSLFTTSDGTISTEDTGNLPGMTFSNNNSNEISYITIDDSHFASEVTAYDSICFKVSFSAKQYQTTELSISLVTNDDTVIKEATTFTSAKEVAICLQQAEMDIYRSQNNGIQLKLEVTKSVLSKAYNLSLSDFCVVDELNRFSVQKTEDVAYGTMTPAFELQQEQYPFVAATYKNDRWQRWSYITILDDDYVENMIEYDSIEFDVLLKTPTIGEFDWVQLDVLNGETKFEDAIILKYNEWL